MIDVGSRFSECGGWLGETDIPNPFSHSFPLLYTVGRSGNPAEEQAWGVTGLQNVVGFQLPRGLKQHSQKLKVMGTTVQSIWIVTVSQDFSPGPMLKWPVVCSLFSSCAFFTSEWYLSESKTPNGCQSISFRQLSECRPMGELEWEAWDVYTAYETEVPLLGCSHVPMDINGTDVQLGTYRIVFPLPFWKA